MPEIMDVLENWKGFTSINEAPKPPDHEAKLKEVIDLLSNSRGLAPHRREFLIREAMTTSDFPLLFGDVLDREVLAAYKGVEAVWKKYTRKGTVSRIYPLVGGKRYSVTGGDQYLDLVPEKGEYQASPRDEAKYDIYVRKYGRQFDISWESLINDDLGALSDTPTRFALAAARTEHRLVVTAYASDIGTHAAGNLYEDGVNKGALPLTIENLQTSVANMRKFTDANGEPILNRPKYLVVGPDLEFTARAILTSATKMYTAEGIDVDGNIYSTAYPTTNVMAQYGLELVVDDYLPVIDPTHVNSWYLFADPANIAAIEHDYLKGHERPEICMKASDKVALGGGLISPMEGDFGTDNVLYRVRLVFGANKLDWRATYMNQVA